MIPRFPMEIVPTITTTDIAVFETQVSRLSPYCTTFQIDIQDGHFVPNRTCTTQDILAFLQSLSPEKLHAYKSVSYDLHLMVADYSPSLQTIVQITDLIPIRYVFVHTNFAYTHDTLRARDLPICPTLNIEDVSTKNFRFLGKSAREYPAVQIMTVHPGPQGQDFLSAQVERVRELREMGYKDKIVLDGSINPTTLEQILKLPPEYKPDIVCVGSYLSRAPDHEIGERVEILKALVV